MSFSSQQLVSVYYHGLSEKQRVGRLLFKNRQLFFEYDAVFIKQGMELSPFRLPLKQGVISSKDRTFDGLFGVFNDSLPDGWGRLLLDRKLVRQGFNPGDLSPLDRLCFVGSHGMGALSYEPEQPINTGVLSRDLDAINQEIQNFQKHEEDRYVEDLLTLGSSSAGARPKILLRIEDEDWLIKFRSSFDPKDIGSIEYAYHLMAKAAGLNVPEAKLFPSKTGQGFFGVKRFDRKENKRIHMHTMAGLLHLDPREASLDYETVLKATIHLTQDIRESEAQFRNAVFNLLSHNRDDHSKNFSFLMDEHGVWSVSPAYDLTFSSGPAGEHSTTILGEGKSPSRTHLLKLAGIADLKKEKSLEIIGQVAAAVANWRQFAKEARVSKLQTNHVGKTLDRLLADF